jgi:hypothetical protein
MTELRKLENNVPSHLKKNLDWYIANQAELSAKYTGKVLLIVDQSLVEAFDTMEKAFAYATGKYEPGTFTLQPCSSGSDSYTVMLYSPAFNAAR